MEDSYTVHRRRKAAARRREKTPEPSSRNQQLVDSSEDEEEARRARMEQMAEDAERVQQEVKETRMVEEVKNEEKKEERKQKEEARKSANLEDSSKRTSHEESSLVNTARAREIDAGEEMRSVRKEVMRKVDEGSSRKESPKNEGAVKEKQQEVLQRPKDESDNTKVTEARKVEKRIKKKSKERLERHSRSSDSSDMEERHARRTKSPESGKIRVKKLSAKRVSSDSDGPRKESTEKSSEKKKPSGKLKLEEPEGQPRPERRHSRRYSQTDDTDEDPKMKKSETFPRYSSPEEHTVKRSVSEVKKQIIPLSNDSLIQDFAKAQREYLKRERSIMEPDPSDVFEDAEEESTLRRRKFSITHTESEQEEIAKLAEEKPEKKKSWFSWLPFFRKKKEEIKPEEIVQEPEPPKKGKMELEEVQELPKKVTLMDFFKALKDVVAEFKAFVAQNPRETKIIRGLRNRCIAELLLIMIYCGLGAFVFRFTEGAFETFYKCGVKRVKRDFLDSLWNYSHNLREDDWKSMARRKLMEFEEQLHTAHEAGVHSYSGQRSWSFLNAVVYCLTVITTIGENESDRERTSLSIE